MCKTFLWATGAGYTRNIQTDKEESEIFGHLYCCYSNMFICLIGSLANILNTVKYTIKFLL